MSKIKEIGVEIIMSIFAFIGIVATIVLAILILLFSIALVNLFTSNLHTAYIIGTPLGLILAGFWLNYAVRDWKRLLKK